MDDIIPAQPRSQGKAVLQALRHLYAAGILTEGHGATPFSAPRPQAGIANISINVTARCNLRCRLCCNLDARTPPPQVELSAGEIIGFLDSIRPLLAADCSLALLGGEPLLCPEKTLELAQYGRRKGLQTIVSTNGHYVTDDFAAGARRRKLEVQVSLDGPSAEMHDLVRGPGAYTQALAGIKRLVHHRVCTILSLVCHQDNLPCLEPFYTLARDLGVNAEKRSIRKVASTTLRPIAPNRERRFSKRSGFSVPSRT
jgi:MoaA/NifB/PqqE/SkfB family radical SAM enzyme